VKRLALLLLIATVALTGCSNRGAAPIATVNGVDIPRNEFYDQLGKLDNDLAYRTALGAEKLTSSGGVSVPTQLSSAYLNFLITREIATELLHARGKPLTEADRASTEQQLASIFANAQQQGSTVSWTKLDEAERHELIDLFTPVVAAVRLAPSTTPKAVTEKQIAAAYKQSLAQLTQVCVHHIVFSSQIHSVAEAQSLAKKAKARLDAGEKFSSVAKDLSDDTTSGAKGGDLGCTAASNYQQISQAFADTVMNAPIGKVTGPTQAGYDWEIVRVDSRKAPSLAAAHDSIQQSLEQQAVTAAGQAQQAAVQKLIDAARKRSSVTVDPRVGRWVPVASDLSGQPVEVPARRAQTYTVLPPKGPLPAPTTTIAGGGVPLGSSPAGGTGTG
jgi:parvulin-like peptidyl-prolyl isomerase